MARDLPKDILDWAWRTRNLMVKLGLDSLEEEDEWIRKSVDPPKTSAKMLPQFSSYKERDNE